VANFINEPAAAQYQKAPSDIQENLNRVADRMNKPFQPAVMDIHNIFIDPPATAESINFIELVDEALPPVLAERTLEGRMFKTSVSTPRSLSGTHERGEKLPPKPIGYPNIVLTQKREGLLSRTSPPGSAPAPNNFYEAMGYKDVLEGSTGISDEKFFCELSDDAFLISTRDFYPQQTSKTADQINEGVEVDVKQLLTADYDDPVVESRQAQLDFFRENDPQQVLNERFRQILMGESTASEPTPSVSLDPQSPVTNNSLLFFENFIDNDSDLLDTIKALPRGLRESLAESIVLKNLSSSEIRLMFEAN